MDEFVVSTEDLNDYGFRVLTEGIQLDRFLKNPVMYFEHEGKKIPIGKWVDLRKEGGKLIGTPKFNEKDEFALKIKQAVEDKFINATSIGATPLKFSDDPKDLLKGQRCCTVVECSLYEISFVGLPSNPHAVRLSANNKDFQVPKLTQKQTTVNMKKIALSLGLTPTATEEEIVKTLEAKESKEAAQNVDVLIALGRANGHVNDKNVEKYIKLAKSDYKTTFELIGEPKEVAAPVSTEEKEATPEAVTLHSVVEELRKGNGTEQPKAETKAQQFLRLSKESPDELGRIKATDPKLFNELQTAYAALNKQKSFK